MTAKLNEMLEDFNKLELPEQHYLRIAQEAKSNYFEEFIASISRLKNSLSEKEFKALWNEKMQLNKKTFNEKGFIQGACEIAVADYFLNKDDFKIEVQVNQKNKKDVDCQFKSNGFTYNIEVKCASFEAKEKVEKSDSFKFHTLGRLDKKDELFSILSNALDEGLTNQGKPLKEHAELKNMDNNLKDFLESAHSKFSSDSSENEVNILLVGCNDKADMQSWIGCLYATQGLFTQSSYSDVSKFNNVDLVVFTNLYFKHKDFFDKKLSDSWGLDHTLNLYFENPNRLKIKREGIDNFYGELTNYNLEYNQFVVPGDAPNEVKEAVRLPHFVIDHLEKGNNTYLFEQKIE